MIFIIFHTRADLDVKGKKKKTHEKYKQTNSNHGYQG